MNLDGEWSGHYFDPRYGEFDYPIVVKFEVTGSRLGGTMVDERTVWTQSIRDLLQTVPKDTSEGREWLDFAAQYPDATCTTRVPAHSRLTGSVQGNAVQFTKEYHGLEESMWSAPNLRPISETRACEPIEYEGSVNPDGTEISGSWSIPDPAHTDLVKRHIATGTFRLVRLG